MAATAALAEPVVREARVATAATEVREVPAARPGAVAMVETVDVAAPAVTRVPTERTATAAQVATAARVATAVMVATVAPESPAERVAPVDPVARRV